MADVHTPDVRSHNMAAIRGADTKPEVRLRKLLHARGFRFRKNVRSLPGTPDIVLPKYSAVIQVNGCFWHGHGCHLFKIPRTRTEFWMEKISGNRERDKQKNTALHELGWRVLTVWECAIKGRSRLSEAEISELIGEWLTSFSDSTDISGMSQESDRVI